MKRAGWFFITVLAFAVRTFAQEGRQEVVLTGPGWHLWRDQEAKWQDDPLFLPPLDLTKIPTNAPSGGWDALGKVTATDAAVPGTVEEYLQTVPGPAGDLSGVSWWWRQVQ